ncbi:MAG: helix-hairpin-helix domain-containing protein [Clostridiaceae bacterium]
MKLNKKLTGSIVIFGVFLICLAVGYFVSRPVGNITEEEIFNEGTEMKNGDVKTIMVYVNGEVKKPGVYNLKSGSRIGDLIASAGGFTEKADIKRVNLAKKLRDEDYIFIDSSDGSAITAVSGINDGIVNINTATKEELMTLPGVGEVTAQKIIDYREKNGDFSRIDDLTKVDRIGEKTLAKFKDKIEAR